MNVGKILAGVALVSVLGAAPAYAEDLVFTLNNLSSGAVSEIYVSALESNNWEEDILGQDVVESGQTATITITGADGQCAWDVRLVYDDGSVTDERNIDLCNLANGNYDVTD